MAVSKHNLWKRKKNGIMKLVRSHRDWLEKRSKTKVRIINTDKNGQWWEGDKEISKYDGLTGKEGRTEHVVSDKRKQLGKKV